MIAAMWRRLRQLGAWLATGPNRIALSTALRGTIATVTPLAVLPLVGWGEIAYPTVLGALNTSMVDVGGSYRDRLIAMTLFAVVGPALLLLGTAVSEQWWLATLCMLAIAVVSGLVRALGPSSTSLGINTSVAFLVGLSVGESGGPHLPWALGFGGGALWTILVALAFWQLRPYRRIEQEIAGAWEAVAALVGAAQPAEAGASIVARRRREQRLTARHRLAREAVERARDALGEMRAGTTGPGTLLAQLTVLLNAAARIGAAAVTLGEVAVPESAPRHAAIAELERSCRDVARILLRGAGELTLDAMRQRVQVLGAGGEAERRADLLALAQAMRHLENAAEAFAQLFGHHRRLGDLLRLPISFRRPSGAALTTLRAHLTPNSAIFRHALRVAVVAALGTLVITRYELAHGIWLPLTSLVILQPEYGGTIARALQRTAGTVAGAVVAGILIAAVHGSAAFDAAIAALLFATFALIRRRYGYAITFLTPIVMLLVGAGSADPWIDLIERIAYTVVGALLALAAGYGLWPQWERERLNDRLAAAIRADRDYLVAALAGLATAAAPDAALAQLRRQAEIAVGNADAAFQRMLGEPAHRRARIDAGFTLLVYVHRLSRHTTALAAHLGVVVAPSAALDALRQLLAAALDDVAQAIGDGRPPAPRPAVDEPLAKLRATLSGGGEASHGRSVAALLDQLVSDTTGLILAPVAPRQAA
jgi:uncharacterized membrane protein YccC